jgi:hypothetical protein
LEGTVEALVRRLEGTDVSSWEIEMRAARRLRQSGNSGRARTPRMITGEFAATGKKVSVLERDAMSARQRLSLTISKRR